MKKLALFTTVSIAFMLTSTSLWAAKSTSSSGDNKVVKGTKAVGRGVMWGPKKVGQGMKKMGQGTKRAFSKKSK